MNVARSMLGPGVWKNLGTVLSQSGPGALLEVPGLNEPARNFLWVYNCVAARMESVQQAALRISDGEDNLVEGGPLYDLLARPNRWMDGVGFVGAIEAILTLRNSVFVVPVSEAGARPDELMLLAPQNVTPIVATHKPTGLRVPVGWKHRDPYAADERTFTLDEVIHIGTFNPDNPLLSALSPQDALMRTLKMDMATREQNLALFRNGGLPDFALVTEREWTEEQAKEFLQRFLDNYQGYAKAHKPALLYNGVKIDKIGLNPQELQALDVLKTLTPQEIVAGLRTKPAMAGLMVGETGLSQGTSTAEQKIAWWSETGHAELARIASALQEFLVDRYDWTANRAHCATGQPMSCQEKREMERQRRRMRPFLSGRAPAASKLFAWFDTGNVPELMEHRWKRVESFERLAGRGYQPDDLNDYFDLGLPPHPTNQGTLPFSLQAVEDVAAGSVGLPPATEPPRAGGRAMDLVGELERKLEDGARLNQKKLAAMRKMFDALLRPLEKGAARKYSRFFLEQRGRVLDRVKGLGPERARDDALSDAYAPEELLKAIFPRDGEDPALLARLAPLWTEQLRRGWEFFAEQESGKAAKVAAFQVDDPRVMAALDGRKLQGTAINDTTEDAFRDVIRAAFEEGDNPAQLADRIDEYYKAHCAGETSHRPMTAARTQTAGIVNEGRLLAANAVGGLKKGWLHGAPEEARPEHLDAQATYQAAPIPLEQDFVVGGVAMKAPGDANAPIEQIANCTCMLTFHAA